MYVASSSPDGGTSQTSDVVLDEIARWQHWRHILEYNGTFNKHQKTEAEPTNPGSPTKWQLKWK